MNRLHGASFVCAFCACALFLATTNSTRAYAFTPGNVFVVNRGRNAVTELTPQLEFVRHWFAGETLGSAPLNQPNGFAFDTDGALYIADSLNERVVVVDGDGRFVREWSTSTHVGAGLESINFDASGVLYASANPGNGNIMRYSALGESRGAVVSGSEWLEIGNVNFNPEGDLLIAPFNDDRRGIRVVDRMTGTPRAEPFYQESHLMEDLAVDGGGVIYANAFTANAVVVINADHSFRRQFMAPGLRQPTGIAILPTCEIVVASFDAQENEPQLYVFAPSGELLRTKYIQDLVSAESIAIVNQILPGSFEFPPPGYETVPACDGSPGTSRDAGAQVDSRSQTDAARNPETMFRTDSSRGACGCHALGGRTPTQPLLYGAIVIGLAFARKRRQ